MPSITKKLLVFAAVDGLLLQPASQRQSPAEQSPVVKIQYGNNKISTARRKDEESGSGLEVHGIVGLLNLVSSSYLVAITRREQVASICEKPIFLIKDVTLISLASKAEAEKGITNAQRLLKQNNTSVAPEQTDDEVNGGEETDGENTEPEDSQLPEKNKPEDEAKALEPPKPGVINKSTSFAKDVVQNKGNYGRFVGKWFSKNGSQSSVKREQGLSDAADSGELTQEQVKQEDQALPESENAGAAAQKPEITDEPQGRTSTEKRRQNAIEYLTPRILKSARLYFSSSGFYFSYEHDLSRSLSQKNDIRSTLPLWKRFDSLFFWNRHLSNPLIEAGQDSLILPIIQGFVGQRAFSIAQTDGDENDVVAEAEGTELADFGKSKVEANKHDLFVTLISRRSIKRAGLRYLRRGVDDEGNVANSVETEQILSYQDWNDDEKSCSLRQCRGSMPMFFSQSPYSFKPTPIMFGSEATNQAAFKKHFGHLFKRYGNVYAASLVDKHGTEVAIGTKYEEMAKSLNENGGVDSKPLGFEWFDFHGECKGMKFENVSILLSTLEPFLQQSGYVVKQGDRNIRTQNGILRTNCMDCLDRTNVVQSAVAGWVLEQQLADLDLKINLKSDPKTQWFNTLWADNGDAISKQYAGTSALKGDFTRTRKRNWTGALSDFSLTLNRYYNNIFGDYFLQTNIDYFLGAGPHVFDEFETDMTSQDYALDMSSIRQNAIETCIKIVLEDPKEDVVSGWTLACPKQSNTLRTHPFEECVLLLTNAALYFCRFDWDTEKLGGFERVDLRDVKEIWRGSYVTSALGVTHLNETKNVGFVIRYSDRGPSMRRTNTRSLSVADGMEDSTEERNSDDKNPSLAKATEPGETRILAFKALPPKASAAKNSGENVANLSEVEATKRITQEVQQAIVAAVSRDQGSRADGLEVQEHDVISAADARKSTGYIESLGYSLKKLVWS